MSGPFTVGQVKCLLIQLLRAVGHMHDNWILHRDLKTSNLLLSHKGILKVSLINQYDPNLAFARFSVWSFTRNRSGISDLRESMDLHCNTTPRLLLLCGIEPLNYSLASSTMSSINPELTGSLISCSTILGGKSYSTPIDLWSVGCIFAEFLLQRPLFPGKGEVDEINMIFRDLGTPNERIWPGCTQLPGLKNGVFTEYPYNQLRRRFTEKQISDSGFDLLSR